MPNKKSKNTDRNTHSFEVTLSKGKFLFFPVVDNQKKHSIRNVNSVVNFILKLNKLMKFLLQKKIIRIFLVTTKF